MRVLFDVICWKGHLIINILFLKIVSLNGFVSNVIKAHSFELYTIMNEIKEVTMQDWTLYQLQSPIHEIQSNNNTKYNQDFENKSLGAKSSRNTISKIWLVSKLVWPLQFQVERMHSFNWIDCEVFNTVNDT